MNGIDNHMTEEQAREWASRRWGCVAETESHPHPTSFGDFVATITVRVMGQKIRGCGYSGLAPWGVSMWAKAAHMLLMQEPSAIITLP